MSYFYILFFYIFPSPLCSSFFFFNDTATTEIYTLSLHDALPISVGRRLAELTGAESGIITSGAAGAMAAATAACITERERTPLESRHPLKSYAGLFL